MKDQKPNSIRYDTETCSRCGGSGHYSYNQRTGTICFKCGGAGTQLTRAGAKARTAVNGFKEGHATLRVRLDLLPGDFILVRAESGKMVSRKIETLDTKVWSYTREGVKTTVVDVLIKTTRPIQTSFGPIRDFGGQADQPERLAFSQGQWDEILDYAGTHSGATVLRKENA